MLTFLAIAQRHRPRWIVWENVSGVLSSNGGRDFGTFLGALGELGYGFAYRVLDAQWFGVAQRRRRVFVVGCLGDWQRPAKVLFERESVCRDTAPRREAQKGTARRITRFFAGNSESKVAATLETTSHDYSRADGFNMVAQPQCVMTVMQLRRLTPVECERLQGFPDNYTNILWRKKLDSPDSPRYKALGNSMAVPVMRWIGERINSHKA
jgi:DNA (cytosine-5)-methyltransferase 1